MLKLGKERGCELVSRWYKACINHFYWAVISTPVLMGEVKLAKFQTFLHHIINKHKDLPNKLFNKCKHGVITVPKAWMLKGMLDITQKRLGIQVFFASKNILSNQKIALSNHSRPDKLVLIISDLGVI